MKQIKLFVTFRLGLVIPRSKHRGLIEAAPASRPPLQCASFRDQNIAASLKQYQLIDETECPNETFRDQNIAASLKHRSTLPERVRKLAFRDQNIAASLKHTRHTEHTPPMSPFRDQNIAASLKQCKRVESLNINAAIPRSKHRGLIEATPPTATATTGYSHSAIKTSRPH